MNYWKENPNLRLILMATFFLLGLVLTFFGWSLTGKMQGLLIMLVGLVLLMTALFLYNASFQTPKGKKK